MNKPITRVPLQAIALFVLMLLLVSASLVFLWPSDVSAKEHGCDQDKGLPALANRFNMTIEEFEEAALIKFHRCHRRILATEAAPSTFRPNVDFPTELTDNPQLPWSAIHPIDEPELYLNVVLNYAMQQCGGDHVDWDGARCGWYHAPWMHDLREPMRGLTRERSSRLGELHPSQTTRAGNWAVSLYNDIGGYGFHRIWGDKKAFPKTKDFAFDEGTMAVKLLFSLATPEEVPYLRYAKTWDIHDGEKIVTARLMQVDVLVKDARVKDGMNPAPNEDLTGWVMGSFLYNGAIETVPRCDAISDDIEGCEAARWRERLIPIGLQWGNDPQIYDVSPVGTPVQHWLNKDVTRMFEHIRVMSGHPPYLGRDGRMNGPVDNHRSTCLACHGRAVDFGRYEEDALRLVPFVAPDKAETDELKRFFRNLDSDDPANSTDENVPFLKGTQSLDYSLQAAVGLGHFRKWVDTLYLSKAEKALTRDITPSYSSPDGIDGDLTIATWNIANLHHETGVSMRSGSWAREREDFERLAEVGLELDADIIGLQEIGSPTALARVLSPEEYHFVMSDRYTPGDEFKSAEERDIYTAFAFRKKTFPKPPKVKTLDAFSTTHFEYDGRYGVGVERPTRAAMSVEFEYKGKTHAILNVHLKSGCNEGLLKDITETHDDQWRRFPCRTLITQLELMENWFEFQNGLGNRVIIMGDFNRKLNDAFQHENEEEKSDPNGHDDFWEDLNDLKPMPLVKGPLGENTLCWPSANKPHHVDFIVADVNVLPEDKAGEITKYAYEYSDEDKYPEYVGKARERISDHCPVTLTINDP